MRKKIAEWLVAIARRIDPQNKYELMELYEPVRLATGYHISKSEVRKFRKAHEEYKSHRAGLNALIDDTKQVILGNIAAGLLDKGLLKFKVKKTLYVANVTGEVIVYKRKDNATKEEEEGGK